MKYYIFDTGNIFCLDDGSSIPPDPSNNDYKKYLEWVQEGNEPEPWNLQ